MKPKFPAFFLLSFLCFLGARSHAQTTQASITGVVTDESKKPVHGATVQVHNESTGFTTSTLTNTRGEYL